MSFARVNRNKDPCRSIPMYETAARNPKSPNWSMYRMSNGLMSTVKNGTTHWRITCSFPQYNASIKTDYVRAAFADFDLMGEFYDECKKVSYISVMAQSCSECTAHWSQGNGNTPHIAAVQNEFCDIKSDKSGNNYFGAYEQYSTTFRCTESSTSTTNYWFGSYV